MKGVKTGLRMLNQIFQTRLIRAYSGIASPRTVTPRSYDFPDPKYGYLMSAALTKPIFRVKTFCMGELKKTDQALMMQLRATLLDKEEE